MALIKFSKIEEFCWKELLKKLFVKKELLTLLAKSVLSPFGIKAVSAIDAAIEKKNFESGMTVFIISNKEMEDIIKIVTLLEESGLLINS